MEQGFYGLFTSYKMEVETHVHIQTQNQLWFHELQLHAITYEMQLEFCDLFKKL